MSSAERPRKTSGAEYLALERASGTKHQLWDGEIFAMAGASVAHNRIVGNLVGLLHAALRGRPCAAYPSDLKVSIADDRYVYPDVSVVCDPVETAGEHGDVVRNPRVIVEVLSPDTAAFDRGDKFDGYRSLTSLSDYVLVTQDKVQVEHYRREADGSWRLRVLRRGAQIALESLGVDVSVDAAYEGAVG